MAAISLGIMPLLKGSSVNVRISDDYGKDIKLTVGNGEKEK